MLADQWEGFTQASQLQGLAVTTWRPASSLRGGSAVQGQGGGAPTLSVAVHRGRWPWSFPGDAGHGQLPPMFCPGPTLPEL